MATEALSQNEIDALLSQSQGVEIGDEEGSEKKEKAVFTYNFRKQKKFNKGDFVLLESIHKKFLRNVEVTLTNVLSTPIMASLAAATELSYSDCMDSFSSPTCIYILNVNQSLGKFIMEIDPNFAFFVIDKILGGNSKDVHTMERELSLIEEKIMHRVVNFMNQDLMDAWERVEKLHIEVDAFYAQPDYVQVLSNTETVILVSMDVRSSDKTLGYVNLCLPSNILEALVLQYDKTAERAQRSVEHTSTDRMSIEYHVRRSILPLRVILGETKMKVNDLLNLDAGDVIYLHSEVNKPIDVYVGDLKLYRALPVKKENSVAIKISDIVRVERLD
ncbi:MAG: flagellar motor switch protein FliM [bacterium]